MMRTLLASLCTTVAAATLVAGLAPAAQASTTQAVSPQDSGIECMTDRKAFNRCVENNGRWWRLDRSATQAPILDNVVNDISLKLSDGNFLLSICGDLKARYSLEYNLSNMRVTSATYSGSDLCPGADQWAADDLKKAFSGAFVGVKPFIGRLELNTKVGLLVFTS